MSAHAYLQHVQSTDSVIMPGLSTLCWDTRTMWGVMVAGVSLAGVSFHARTDAGISILCLMPGWTAWLKLKGQHCLSDNINN